MRNSKKTGVIEVISKKRLINGAYICTVDFTSLFYPDYQRDVIKKHVKYLAGAWDVQFARPLLCSLRDTRLNCIDGRQTATAALERGITSGLAFVWDNWNYERECKAFYIFNSVPKKMNGWKNFDADMKAGNDTNRLALNLLHNMGLTTALHPEVVHPGLADVPKCGIIREVVRLGGLPLLLLYGKVLKGWKIEGAVPDTAKAIDFGRGLKNFLFELPAEKHGEALKMLKIITPDQIRAIANTKESKGRIDATQIRQALESQTGMLPTLRYRKAS